MGVVWGCKIRGLLVSGAYHRSDILPLGADTSEARQRLESNGKTGESITAK